MKAKIASDELDIIIDMLAAACERRVQVVADYAVQLLSEYRQQELASDVDAAHCIGALSDCSSRCMNAECCHELDAERRRWVDYYRHMASGNASLDKQAKYKVLL